jgi:hypothetical protein
MIWWLQLVGASAGCFLYVTNPVAFIGWCLYGMHIFHWWLLDVLGELNCAVTDWQVHPAHFRRGSLWWLMGDDLCRVQDQCELAPWLAMGHDL